MVAGPESIRALSEYADKRIKPRLERVPGVGSVALVGGRQREIRVWIDPCAWAATGWPWTTCSPPSQREHVELPGGRIETEEREWALRTEGKLTSAEQFGGDGGVRARRPRRSTCATSPASRTAWPRSARSRG